MENQGGGFYSEDGSPVVRDCTFLYNSAAAGGGFFVLGGDGPLIERSTFHHNHANGIGGALGIESGAFLQIRECDFQANSGGAGGAICVAAGSALISDCVVDSNNADFGGGINIMSSTWASLQRTIVTDNTATTAGGGIYALYGEDAAVVNCTITDNTCSTMGGGFYCSSTELLVKNSIVADNHGNAGMYFADDYESALLYNDFWNNGNADFLGDVPLDLGIPATTNANGDSCDVFFNIFLAPSFLDPGQKDFHLNADSPCIDAGDPASTADPDGTPADMGAHFFDQGFLLWCELETGEIVLQWYPLPDAVSYWVYGAPEDAWFEPGLDEPYHNRLDVLPGDMNTWASTLGIDNPTENWFFLIVAVDQEDQELRCSTRVAEHDFAWILPEGVSGRSVHDLASGETAP